MLKKIALSISLIAPLTYADVPVITNELGLGPLSNLIGTWKSVDIGGVDVAPAQKGTSQQAGNPAVEPFYEVITFEDAADATNASEQKLVAIYYKQEVFKKSDDSKFHDQRGYLIYDKENQIVYNSYCIPRAVCVVSEGKLGDKITFKTSQSGIAQSSYMVNNATTNDFSMLLDMSQKNKLHYSQTTSLNIYGKPFAHTDSSSLIKIK